MLYVKTYLAKSPIHGIGIFAGEPIEVSVMIAHDDTDLIIDREVVESFPKEEMCRKMFEHYGYIDKQDGKYHLSQGMEIFFNESEHPNCRSFYCDGYLVTEATRNIKEGEELTCNYKEFEK